MSNSVETEQIVLVEDDLASYVQIRGSIPLFWRQNINIRYKPPFEFYNHQNMARVFEAHFKGLIEKYGQVTAINLVNQRGWEGELAKMFGKHSRELANSNMNYVAFDFNKECPRMQWHRVSGLLDQVESDMKQQGWFTGKLELPQGDTPLVFAAVSQTQNGVLRTNCIDCLDRTNLVQGFFARHALTLQLRQFGVLGTSESVQDCSELEAIFKQIWADNGDAISRQYSGTGALKADFTRTGRRTHRGLLADGLNSLLRYFLNNFYDGAKQDAMDLFYGHYTVRLDNHYSPFIYQFDYRFYYAPAILALCLFFIVYIWLLLSWTLKGKLFVSTLFSMVAIFALLMIGSDGVNYVQYPRLRPPPVATYARPWRFTLADQKRRIFEAIDPSRKVHVI